MFGNLSMIPLDLVQNQEGILVAILSTILVKLLDHWLVKKKTLIWPELAVLLMVMFFWLISLPSGPTIC